MNVKLVDFNTLFKESDYISLHMPLNKETTHMVDAKAFAMANRALLSSTPGRGGLIDEQALIDALKSGKVGGAGLDVVENIPVQSPLDSMDNVIITPHVAYYSEASLKDLQRIAAEQCHLVLTGYYPTCFVNRELKDKISLKNK